MTKIFFIAPTAINSGLTSVCLGLVRAFDTIGLRVGFFKPISQSSYTNRRRHGVAYQAPFQQLASDHNHRHSINSLKEPLTPLGVESSIDRSIHFISSNTNLKPPQPIPLHQAQQYVSQNNIENLMEEIITNFELCTQDVDVVVVEGLVPDRNEPYTARLNVSLAKNLNADVILVASAGNKTPKELDEHLKLSSSLFSSSEDPDVVGCILNKVNPPAEERPTLSYGQKTEYNPDNLHNYKKDCTIFKKEGFQLIGQVPWRYDLTAPRMLDIARLLDANIINEGDINKRRITFISVCARTIPNIVDQLAPGTLIITPGDRDDVIVASCLAALNGVTLAGIILTGSITPSAQTLNLCRRSMSTGLPILSTDDDTFTTVQRLLEMNNEVPTDDHTRIEKVMQSVSENIDMDWLKARCQIKREPRLSPPAFRHQLTLNAKQANKIIVLPEGTEPRTIKAAATCIEKKIARCILLGDPALIKENAKAKGIVLPEQLQIINPEDVRQKYVEPMVALRKHKGLTNQMALTQLEDNVVLGTMMLALDEVDGLVSGAVHTTANTIRPALQLIKTQTNAKIVSSVFFMCLPDQVLVYGDCAVNPDPNAEELADIAIQSAESAIAFGITPKVAMISYSTGVSGSGLDVEKVREATRIAKEKRPDLLIDGPLQYDAAAIESVAKSKAPNSPVAGHATVFIFPDLNTGNTTYKAVQRSANVVSIGPMLQGLKKPVNDLSRGALVDDITFTIALTAIQASQVANQK